MSPETSELISLAERGDYTTIRDQAVSELASDFGLEESELEPVDLKEVRSGSGGGYFEGRTVKVNLDASPHMQAEGIYEEVAHVLTHNDTPEAPRSYATFWDNIASEMLGGIGRWEHWDLQHSLDRSAEFYETEMEDWIERGHASETRDQADGAWDEIRNPIIHDIGYSLSKFAKEEGYRADELGSMTNQELRREFSEEVDGIRERLRDQYGIMVDLDKRTARNDFTFYVKDREGLYSAHGKYQDWNRNWLRWEEEELPDSARI